MGVDVYASKLRIELDMNLPPFSPKIAFQKLDVMYQEVPLDGCLGTTVRIPGGPSGVMVSSEIIEPGKVNFTAAHELGHLTIPSHANRTFRCDESSLNWFKSKANPQELEANEFAAEWLLPKDIFRAKLKGREPGFDLIMDLCAIFETTITATATRLVELTDHQMMLVVSTDNQMKYFKRSHDFPYFLDFGATPKSAVRRVANEEISQEDYLSVESDMWFKGRQPESGEAYEWSLKLRDYPTVLTLIWVEE